MNYKIKPLLIIISVAGLILLCINLNLMKEILSAGKVVIAANYDIKALTSLQIEANKTFHLDRFNDSQHIPLPPKTLGAFIHIGKTGGSTISLQLVNGCHSFVPKPCKNRPQTIHPESAVSKLTTYYHVPDFMPLRGGSSQLFKNAHNYNFFIFTLRDPLDRAISSFLYTHPKNRAVELYNDYKDRLTTEQFKNEMKGKGSEKNLMESFEKKVQKEDRILYSCFPLLESYAGALDDFHDYEEREDWEELIRIGECSKVAKMTLNHGIPNAMQHQYWDLRKISEELRDIDLKNLTVFTIRTNALVKDWKNINNYLGQEGNVTISPNTSHARNSKSRDYPIKNILSIEARQKLCLYLEKEYEVYLQLLIYAENIKPKDLSDNFKHAQKNCPWLNLKIP